MFVLLFSPFPEPGAIVESLIEKPVLGVVTLENTNNHHITFQLVEEKS